MARTKQTRRAESRPPLHDACARGSLEEVAALLHHETHQRLVEMRDEPNGGQTPLILACMFGHERVAQLLLERGQASVDTPDSIGRTPFSFAEKPQVAQLLLRHGAKVGGQELIKASQKGDLETVKMMLVADKKNSRKDDGPTVVPIVNYQDRYGCTPLHHAYEQGNFSVAKHLLENGAELTIPNARGHTPLQFASNDLGKDITTVEDAISLIDKVAGKNALYHQLVEAIQVEDFTKAQTLLETDGAISNAVHPKTAGPSPLGLVSECNNVEFAKILLQHGADVNLGGLYLRPPLITAIKNKHWDLFQVLIQADGLDLSVHDYGCRTALHHAAELGQYEMVKLLMDKGADLHVKSDDSNGGATPLHFACSCSVVDGNTKAKLIELLLQKGSDPNAREFDDNRSPLHLIAISGRHNAEDDRDDYTTAKRMVGTLIEHGADVDARDGDEDNPGNTPLNLAIRCRNYNMAKALLEHGVNVDLVASINDGCTNLHDVSIGWNWNRKKSLDLLKLLIPKCANIDVRTLRGDTPLHKACYAGHYHSVNVLLASGADLLATNADGETCLDMAHVEHDLVLENGRMEYPPNTTALAECLEKTVQLVQACQGGNVESISTLCTDTKDFFAHVNIPASSGQYLIHHVCRHGLLQAAQRLVAKGAKINANRDCDGKTPLDWALEAGNKELVEWIQDDGARIDYSLLSVDERNHLLFEALEHENCDIARVQYLIDNIGASVNCKDKYNSNRTPLHAAAANDCLDVAQLLIDRGANVNALDSWGCSPLHVSARNSLNVTMLLIGNNADINVADEVGDTPCHVASRCRHVGVTKVLLENGADFLAKNSMEQLPSMLARHHDFHGDFLCWTNTLNLVKAVLEENAAVIQEVSEQDIFPQVRVPDSTATTALSWEHFVLRTVEFVAACLAGNLEMLEHFVRLDIFAQKEIPETSGEFLLHHLCRQGRFRSAQNLVQKGANVNATRHDEKTAVALAAKHGHLDVVKWLVIDQNADVSLADKFGNTPLHHACREGHLMVVEFLVAASGRAATFDARNWLNETPKKVALKHGRNDIVAFFAGL